MVIIVKVRDRLSYFLTLTLPIQLIEAEDTAKNPWDFLTVIKTKAGRASTALNVEDVELDDFYNIIMKVCKDPDTNDKEIKNHEKLELT